MKQINKVRDKKHLIPIAPSPSFKELIHAVFDSQGEKIVTITEYQDPAVWRSSKWDIHADGTVGYSDDERIPISEIKCLFMARLMNAMDGAVIIIRRFDAGPPQRTIQVNGKSIPIPFKIVCGARFANGRLMYGIPPQQLQCFHDEGDPSEVFRDWPGREHASKTLEELTCSERTSGEGVEDQTEVFDILERRHC